MLFVYVRVGVVQQHRHTAIIAFWNLVKKKTPINFIPDQTLSEELRGLGLLCQPARSTASQEAVQEKSEVWQAWRHPG